MKLDRIFLMLAILFNSVVSIAQNTKSDASHQVFISGNMEGLNPADTLILIVWDKIIGDGYKYQTPYREFKSANKNGRFSFAVPQIKSPTYFSLGISNRMLFGKIMPVLDKFILMYGDAVNVTITTDTTVKWMSAGDGTLNPTPYTFHFSGSGTVKYNCLQKVDSLINYRNIALRYKLWTVKGGEIEILDHQIRLIDTAQQQALAELSHNRPKVEADVYDMIRARIIGDTEWQKLYVINGPIFNWRGIKQKNSLYKLVLNLHQKWFGKVRGKSIHPDVLARSPHYLRYLTYKLYFDEVVAGNTGEYSKVYEKIKSTYTDKLRDYLVLENYFTAMGVDYFLHSKNKDTVRDMLATVVDRQALTILKAAVDRNTVGLPAYDFELPDAAGNYWKLSDLKGKVIFIDLWFTGCGGCAAYYKNVLHDVEEVYKDRDDVKFITISIDGTKEQWLRALKGGAYTGEHAINLYTDEQGSRHPFIENYSVTGYPSPFLIDKNGTLITRGMEKLGSQTNLIASIEEALKK